MNEKHGLERRVRQETRRISSQHRKLDTLFAMLEAAVRNADPILVRQTFERFGDALDAHFSLEDGFYFPALHGLHPELDHQLAELVKEHETLRSDLAALGAALEDGPASAAEAALDRFAGSLTLHEEKEERLVAGIRGSRRPAAAD